MFYSTATKLCRSTQLFCVFALLCMLQASVADVMASVANHRDKDRSPFSMILFGNGDGGGGPTEAHCEAMARLSDSAGKRRHVGLGTMMPC